MPIYEYVCLDCGRKSTFLTLGVGAAFEPKCRHCGSADLRKLVSRVAVFRSEKGGDDFDDEAGGWDENEPPGPMGEGDNGDGDVEFGGGSGGDELD
jgi:putative FmdB family regulatory protein